jgi:hypothetical protein
MIEPKIVILTKETLDTLPVDEILYAEYAPLGAMGIEGRVILYIIINDIFACYEVNINEDINLYNDAVKILENNSLSSQTKKINNINGIFKYYGGGMGNNVFINKNISLKIGYNHFVYEKDNKEYSIFSSVQGVFERVVYAMMMYKLRKERRMFMDNFDVIDEAKKQTKLIYDNLDKEIITGKRYTEKEINEIIKGCGVSQDYVSFRRMLIDKGYLCRTNNCWEYWRN